MSVTPANSTIYAASSAEHHTLYHLGFCSTNTDFAELFGDVQIICIGGSAKRFRVYAEEFKKIAGLHREINDMISTDRFCMYKTGPVLWVNHGMGGPSISILLVELFDLIRLSGALDVEFIRIGTSGGISVPPGTIILSTKCYNAEMQPYHLQTICGKTVQRESAFNEAMVKELLAEGQALGIPVQSGATLSADDFYEGQGRRDGFFADVTADERASFIESCKNLGVLNIETEGSVMASYTKRAGFRAAMICVTIICRDDSDTVSLSDSEYKDFESRPFLLVASYILKKLDSKSKAEGVIFE